MAKSKRGQNYHYFFGESSGAKLNSRKFEFNYEVRKIEDDGDGIPVEIYHVWGDAQDRLVCSCPAAYHHARQGPCKHVGWVQRWVAITEKNINDIEEARARRANIIPKVLRVFYNAADDRFYPMPSHILIDEC